MKEPKPRRLPSGRWFVRVRVDGRDIGITEDTEARAKARALALKTGLQDVARNPSRILLGDAVDEYINNREGILSPPTLKAYRSYRENRFASLMNRRVCELTSSICQKAIAAEMRTVGPKTVRNAWGLVAAAVSETDHDRVIRVKLPEKPRTTGRAIPPEEMREIFREIRGTRYELPLLLDAFLGLRRSELFALRKTDFDFNRGVLTISRAFVTGTDGFWFERNATKTRAGYRTVAVPADLLAMVQAEPDTGDRLFAGIHPNTPYNVLRKITDRRGLPRVRLHDLRHTFASVSHLLGVPERYTMEAGGWSSKPVLDSVYTHTIEDGRREYAQRVAEYYETIRKAAQ